MSDTKENIVSKIMKLMELSREQNNSNPHEREAASRKAAQMMAEYSVDFADLRDKKPDQSAFVTYTVAGSGDVFVDYEASLAMAITEAFDCKMIVVRNCGWHLKFCGTKHDLEIVTYFFKHVRRTMYAMANINVKETDINVSFRKRIKRDLLNARRNYCFGLVETISKRLLDLYKKREEFIPSDCKALVVVKKEEVTKYFHQQFPLIKKNKVRTLTGDFASYTKGKNDGKIVNLSRPITNNNKTGLIQ